MYEIRLFRTFFKNEKETERAWENSVTGMLIDSQLAQSHRCGLCHILSQCQSHSIV